ncbi:hypothetical protein P7K49_018530 [Saguinus oedipus]|uniref:Uncharacterized protein n=1 Tax=Saguinus oedipus TaxID=9490 RepID=A0ABQ9V5L9_SAGOE|nr:hypothetical protein P7K49_018530 [Saguinus oedipus]
MAVQAVPVVLSARGFTGAGMAENSIAAKMMSAAAIADRADLPRAAWWLLCSHWDFSGELTALREMGRVGKSPGQEQRAQDHSS